MASVGVSFGAPKVVSHTHPSKRLISAVVAAAVVIFFAVVHMCTDALRTSHLRGDEVVSQLTSKSRNRNRNRTSAAENGTRPDVGQVAAEEPTRENSSSLGDDFLPARGTENCTAPTTGEGVRFAWLICGSYRESPSSLKAISRSIATIETAIGKDTRVSVFVITSPPLNVKLIHETFGDRVVVARTLTTDEIADETRLVEAASGFPAAQKGHLLQYYKMYLGLKAIAAREKETARCFNVVAKLRFDHLLDVKQGTAAQWVRRVVTEPDSVWHHYSDYFMMGSRCTMGKMLTALFTGGCSVHPKGLHVNASVIGRADVDKDYLMHAVFPAELKDSPNVAAFWAALLHGQKSFWVIAPDEIGIYNDANHYYGTRGQRMPWADRTPQEHLCYAEAQLAGTVLTHQLALYDAGKMGFVGGGQANDWKRVINVPGRFGKCVKTPEEGRPRDNGLDMKIFVQRDKAEVRMNKYSAQALGVSDAEFVKQYVMPALNSC